MRISDWSSDVCSSDLQSENINGLVCAGSDEVRAYYPPCLLLHQGLVAVDSFGDPPSSKPVRSALALETKFQPRVIRFGLGETNPGDRRKSKGNARHPFVIGLAVIAVDKIGRDDFCKIGRAHV